jgi:hypothetical protein
MATRPIFAPKAVGSCFVARLPTEFVWHPGLSKTQKQKSINALHRAGQEKHSLKSILEISTKSESEVGVRLSAFNLQTKCPDGREASVEVVFQGSKTFANGGPFLDIFGMHPREAKKDSRLKESGQLIGFSFGSDDWPLVPQTAFYDWLYLSAVRRDTKLSDVLLEYDAFTDIEFNPGKSINCQAYSAALFKSLSVRNLLDQALSSPREFLQIHSRQNEQLIPVQGDLL